MARVVCHEVEVIRQFGAAETLEQGQDIAAQRRVDEIVGVLDAGADAFERLKLAHRIVAEPVL